MSQAMEKIVKINFLNEKLWNSITLKENPSFMLNYLNLVQEKKYFKL